MSPGTGSELGNWDGLMLTEPQSMDLGVHLEILDLPALLSRPLIEFSLASGG